MSDLKSFSKEVADQFYNFKYQVDELNQKILIKGVYLPSDTRNIIAAVNPELIDSVRAELEATHLTHAA